MIIRRSFDFCAMHIVRNCHSKRCSQSLHGHNYEVEVFLESSILDRAGMVLDFGILKGEVASFIDCFDHAAHFWVSESEEFKDFIKRTSSRWVQLPFNASAENYSLLFFFYIEMILNASDFGNGENVRLKSVRIHETKRGYAEASRDDFERINETLDSKSIVFSPGVLAELKGDLFKSLELYEREGRSVFIYQAPHQQC